MAPPLMFNVKGVSDGIQYSLGLSLGDANPTDPLPSCMSGALVLPPGATADMFAAQMTAWISTCPGYVAVHAPPATYFTITASPAPGPFRLWVGDAGSIPRCQVNGNYGCSFNPTITDITSQVIVPTMGDWGLVTLTLLLLTAAALMIRRRRHQRS